MDNEDKLRMINLYKKYGYNFPVKAIYHKPENVIPFITDFKDGEEITFWWNCEKPSSCALGYAYYSNKQGQKNLVNIKNIIAIN